MKDKALLDDSRQANDAVIAALADYKKWLQKDLLKGSTGEFAIGVDTYRKKLAADEMIDVPLDELLVSPTRSQKNQEAFAETAQAHRSEAHAAGGAGVGRSRSSAGGEAALATTQQELDAIGRFMTDHHIVTIPKAAPARVQETPPFLRATTSASMDMPGPFEKVATEAYYNMTLPDPKWSAAETRGVHAAVVLRGDRQRLGARGLAGPLPAVPLREAISVRRPQGVRRRDATPKAGRTTASRW